MTLLLPAGHVNGDQLRRVLRILERKSAKGWEGRAVVKLHYAHIVRSWSWSYVQTFSFLPAGLSPSCCCGYRLNRQKQSLPRAIFFDHMKHFQEARVKIFLVWKGRQPACFVVCLGEGELGCLLYIVFCKYHKQYIIQLYTACSVRWRGEGEPSYYLAWSVDHLAFAQMTLPLYTYVVYICVEDKL